MVFIDYITNNITKNNYSQYQKIIVVAIVTKVANNYINKLSTDFFDYRPIIDKFALKVFDRWFYD